MLRRAFLLWLVAGLLLGGVQAQRELVVFAAASLTDAYEAIAEAFEAENPGVEVLFNFGGSSTLAAQLVQGAPADVFASANPRQMQVAVDGGRIAGTPRTFARNRLVVIVPADNPANIQSLRDLATPDVNFILAAPEVPVRVYADTMLDRLTAEYGDEYRAAVLDNLVSEEPNVRQVAAKVALGEADAGVVYTSDVTPDIATDVLTIPVPDAFNTVATYPIAVTDDAGELAAQFVDFVLSDAGQDILVEWGFISVRIEVTGQVMTPLAIMPGDFPAQTVGDYSGASLWAVIGAAEPDIDGDPYSLYVVVRSADGREVVFSWGELDPALGNATALLTVDGGLVVPTDRGAGRSLPDVVSIRLHG